MILLSTGSVHLFGLRRAFEVAAEVGFAGVEVVIDHRVDSFQSDYLARIAADNNLCVPVLHYPFLDGIVGWPQDAGGRIRRSVELAEELGAGVVVAHLPTRWPIRVLVGGGRSRAFPLFWRRNHQERDWFLNELPRLQANTPVKIAVEMMPRFRLAGWQINAHYWNNLDEWTRFPHLTLDTTHCGTWGIDPRQAFDRAGGRVSHVHLSNYDGREHVPPHRGELALDAFLQHLAAAGYEGHISVETTPATMNFEDQARVRQNLADSLAFCRQHFSA